MSLNTSPSQQRAIGPIGTVGRVILGLCLILVAVWNPEWWGAGGLRWYEAVLGLVGFPAAVLLIHWLWLQVSTDRVDATGGLGFCVNLAVGIALVSIPYTRDAFALFLGSSLLLAAAWGYAGCEVTAISNWLLRRDDQVGCVVFSPIDEVEAQLTRKAKAT